MIQYLLLGAGFASAAGVQPGPLQAFLLQRTIRDGWRRTLPAALSPVLSDGPIALLVLLLLGRLPVPAQHGLRAAGGLLLLFLAWAALRQWRSPSEVRPDSRHPGPRTLIQAALVNLLNPNPYLGWTLVLGPAVVRAWHESALNAVVLVVAFYGTIVATLAGFILLAGTSRSLGPREQRALALASALILAGLGVYQIAGGVASLRSGPGS